MSAHGITLITLIITIIILLILAGVTINLTLGDNGLFSTAKQAKEEYSNAQTSEEEGLNDLYSEMLVATGDDSKITISVEDLKKLIQEEIQNTFCNPKVLTTITLPSSASNARAVGTYYANSTSYTKTNTTDFDSYLSFDANTGWTVLRSGYYMIKSKITSQHNGAYVDTYNYITINGVTTTLQACSERYTNEYTQDINDTTIFLEKGTIINFANQIEGNKSTYHSVVFTIYALFQ